MDGILNRTARARPQAKRTNVGIALVSNPRVLFLDEPTSGLDSYTASEVMEVVKVRDLPAYPTLTLTLTPKVRVCEQDPVDEMPVMRAAAGAAVEDAHHHDMC